MSVHEVTQAGMTGKLRQVPLKTSDAIVLLIIALTLFIYIQVKDFKFIDYDDPKYVAGNYHVIKGLSLENIKWAFTSIVDSNWLPLTLITHMIDVEVYGLKPGGHHFTNLILHTLNSVLLFILFERLLVSKWTAAFVALMFAVHPMHVESVAWIAERKDVLCGFFWMLTMLSYVQYVQKRKAWLLIFTAFLYMSALMSKPMAVTLPFVLLLMDYWPLKRFQLNSGFKQLLLLIMEKIPMFALSVVSSAVTFYAQKAGGSVAKLEYLPLSERFKNAFAAYITYIIKMIFPTAMAAIYTIENPFPVVKALASLLCLIIFTVLAVIYVKKQPSFFTGWFWFMTTLVPVIGIVQVGSQAMADRYTYIPYVGLFIAIAMAVPKKPSNKIYTAAVAIIFAGVTMFFMLTAHRQVSFWASDVRLFEHALSVTRNNYIAMSHLGAAYTTKGRYEEAEIMLTKSIITQRNYPPAYINLGNTLVRMGRLDEAAANYQIADSLKPGSPYVYNGMGVVMMLKGDTAGAEMYFRKALSADPFYLSAINNLKRLYGNQK